MRKAGSDIKAFFTSGVCCSTPKQNILSKYIDKLHGIANALLEYESISGDEMKQIINGDPIVRIVLKPKTKRVRRRKRVSKEDPAGIQDIPPIATKPAT